MSAPADSHKEERKQTDENVHVEKKFLDDSEESSQIDYRSVIAFMNKRKGTHLSAKQRQYIEAYDLTGLTLEKAASLFDGHFTNKKHQRVKSWPEHEKSKPRFERQYERLETGPIPEETIPEFLERAGCDPSFRHFLGLYAVSGRELTLPEVKAAWAYWQRMNESQRERTKDHAERTFPLKDASFLKSPENYLKSQPWTAIQMPRALPRAKQDKPDPNAEARRLLREEAARNGGFIRL